MYIENTEKTKSFIRFYKIKLNEMPFLFGKLNPAVFTSETNAKPLSKKKKSKEKKV